MDLVHSNIDKKLTEFAIAAGPSKKHWKEGKLAVQKIVEVLQRDPGNEGYKIGWMVYSGSVGKRTALRDSDFDILVFINDHRPPLTDCLIHFEDILLRNQHSLKIEGIARIPLSLQFKITSCGINVDLVPAANFLARQPYGMRQRERIVEQHHRALEALRKEACPEKAFSKYSSSLSVFQRQFMRDQEEFTVQAVRIAKIWYKSLYIGKPAYGVKTMLELVVVASVMEEASEPKSHLSVFHRFLKKVKSIDSVQIEFTGHNAKWSLNLPKRGVQGYVIDPSNPYNNLLKRTVESPKFCTNLKDAASRTLVRLDSARLENIVNCMFTPLYLPTGEWTLRGKEIRKEIIGHVLNYPSQNPDMRVQRKQEKLKEPDYMMTVEVIKKLLMHSVNALSFSVDNPRETPSAVLEKIRVNAYEMVATEVLGKKVNWGPSPITFETCDIVLTLPVPNVNPTADGENIGAIKFGFCWSG